MVKTRRAFAALIVGVIGFGSGTVMAEGNRHSEPIVFERTCAEDEPYLRGRGDFDGQTWARYECIHTDRVHLKH